MEGMMARRGGRGIIAAAVLWAVAAPAKAGPDISAGMVAEPAPAAERAELPRGTLAPESEAVQRPPREPAIVEMPALPAIADTIARTPPEIPPPPVVAIPPPPAAAAVIATTPPPMPEDGATPAGLRGGEEIGVGTKASLQPAEPLPSVEPGPAVDPALAAIAEAIRQRAEALDIRPGTLAGRDRAAVAAFYAARAHAPVWLDKAGQPAPKARAVLERLKQAAEDGLDPADYRVALPPVGAPAGEIAAAEIALSEAVLKFARHAQAGRIDPGSLSNLVTPTRPFPDPATVLPEVSAAADPAARLDAFNPPHEGFRRLKAWLAAERAKGAASAASPVLVPPGPALRPGQRDTRVAALRARLGVRAASDADADLYAGDVVEAVRNFQRGRKIVDAGILGPQTLAALNAAEDKPSGIPDAIANMERWRWLPRDLGRRHVMVNVPDFMLTIRLDGAPVHTTRVIVGKTETPTPIFSNAMDHIIVNPYWNVPPSIFKDEFLSKIQANGGRYLAKGNYEVVVGSKVVDPDSIDWSQVKPGSVRVRQRPGEANALGHIKFMFPNQHAVYLHDTPTRNLFQKSFRAFSHGCVRVHEPFAFADALLADEAGLDGKKLKAMIGGEEKYVRLKSQIPVHIVYFTTWVDDSGRLQSRPDLYGYHRKVREALGLAGPNR